MSPNPILKVLSTLKEYRVKCLLIGGQACIIYGAAEFSRDSDFTILNTPGNLKSLNDALCALRVELIYLPPFEAQYLERGHACHFRCNAEDVKGLRVDVISKLRGCEPFDKLWERRNTVKLQDNIVIDVIGLLDLVQSKKTQRDKDWIMLKRLVDNDIILSKANPSNEQISWWLKECRDAVLLIELAEKYPTAAKERIIDRPLLSAAINADNEKLTISLREEELLERQKDITYWVVLRKELENLRHKKL